MNKQPINILKLAARLPHQLIGKDVEVKKLAIDSRQVESDSLFFCLPGLNTDGHGFAEEAIIRGAEALVVERVLPLDKPQLKVESTRAALGIMSAEFYGWPCTKLKTIGITGTNGKTTTTFMIKSIAEAAGKRSAAIGTLGIKSDSYVGSTSHTTPEALEIQQVFARLAANDVEIAAMEVSSHAIHFKRHYGCLFDVLGFTNLSHDHLDFHSNLEDYWGTKKILFEEKRWQKDNCCAIINAEEIRAPEIAQIFSGNIFYYGDAPVSQIKYKPRAPGFYDLSIPETGEKGNLRINLPGKINLLNALAAGTAMMSIGFSLTDVCRGISSLKTVPGRMEEITPEEYAYKVYVDYAHTPEGLRNVLIAGRQFLKQKGRLILIFGCGGDRDHEKRPKMGKIAMELADIAILTSDNPRNEDPLDIMKQVKAGDGGDKLFACPDRKEAIAEGLQMAREGDLVLIAGKGHEQGQIVGSKVFPFDDRKIARELLGLNND